MTFSYRDYSFLTESLTVHSKWTHCLIVLSLFGPSPSQSTLLLRTHSLSQYSVFTDSVSLTVLSLDGLSLSQYSL